MERRTRQQRARDAASGLRRFTPEESVRVASVVLPYTVVSLGVQGLLLVVVARRVREVYRARPLGRRQVLSSAGGPVLGLLVVNLAQMIIDRRLSRWARRLNASPPD